MSKIENVILLTGETEGPYLADSLRRESATTEIRIANDLKTLVISCDECGERLSATRLISFACNVVVPASLIECMPLTGYNFHAGPPEYPGSLPASFAIWESAPSFGVTLHELAPRVDSGPIAAVERFDCPPSLTATDLNGRAYQILLALFSRFAGPLVESENPLPLSHETWRGAARTRAEAIALMDARPEDDAVTADRRRRAFGLLRT